MVRIADFRTTSRVIEAKVTMQMLNKEKTSREGLWRIKQKVYCLLVFKGVDKTTIELLAFMNKYTKKYS